MKIEQLISAVYARNSLWDQNDASHRNRYVLDKLWDEVALEMESTREAVRSKWKTLRDTYRKELHKVAKAQEKGPQDCVLSRSTNYTHLRSWAYFKSLSFLRDQFEAGRGRGHFDPLEAYTTTTQQFKRSRSETPDVDDVEPKSSPTTTQMQTQQQLQAQDMIKKIPPKPERKVENDDEDMHFFKSLLPHVKQLSPQKKMLLRLRLQEIVYDFVYEQNNASEALTYPMEGQYFTN